MSVIPTSHEQARDVEHLCKHGSDGCFPTAIKVDDRSLGDTFILGFLPLVTIPFSRKSRLITIGQLSIHGNNGSSFWGPDVLPDVNQLGLGKRR